VTEQQAADALARQRIERAMKAGAAAEAARRMREQQQR
jgi:hypothetical protein